jgi:hypothetical protein
MVLFVFVMENANLYEQYHLFKNEGYTINFF